MSLADPQPNVDDLKRIVRWQARTVAANVLRICAGAGKPHELPDDCCNLAEAAFKLEEAGHPSFWEIATTLNVGLEQAKLRRSCSEADSKRWWADGTFEREFARDAVIDAGMRVAAARLLSQATQETTNEYKLHFAIEEAAAAHAERKRKARP